MSGYFNSLVKQSGASIGGDKSSVVVGQTAPRPTTVEPVTPLHVKNIALVEPTAGELNHQETISHPRPTRDQISNVAAPTDVATSISTHELSPRSNQIEKTVPDQSDSDFLQDTSLRSVARERRAETMPEPYASENVVVENESKKITAGVVRIGERRNMDESELLSGSDARSEAARALTRQEFPIPPDYLQGIREWLSAPPVNSDEIATERSIGPHENDFSVPRETHRSLPHIELNSSSRDELQEFSLSIGSISIVVEEPARQPPPPPNSQPAERTPANTQPRAKDAFALSRSYFRGF